MDDMVQMPSFSGALYATSLIQVLDTGTCNHLLLLICERAFGVGIFDPTLGGDPVLFSTSSGSTRTLPFTSWYFRRWVLFQKLSRCSAASTSSATSSSRSARLRLHCSASSYGDTTCSPVARAPWRVSSLVPLPLRSASRPPSRSSNWLATMYRGSIRLGYSNALRDEPSSSSSLSVD